MNAGFSNESIGGYGSAFGGGMPYGGWGGYGGGFGGYGMMEMFLLFALFGGRGFGNFMGRDGHIDGEAFHRETGCNLTEYLELLKDAINNKTGAVEKIADGLKLDSEFVKQCCCDAKAKLAHIDEKIDYSSEKVLWHTSDKIHESTDKIKNFIEHESDELEDQIERESDKVMGKIDRMQDMATLRHEWVKDNFCNFRNENQRDHFATRLEIERTEGRLSRQSESNKDAILAKLNYYEMERKEEKIHELQEKLEKEERRRDYDRFNFKLDGIVNAQSGLNNSLATIIGTGNTVTGPTNSGTAVA